MKTNTDENARGLVPCLVAEPALAKALAIPRSNREPVHRSRLELVFARLAVCCVLAVSGEALPNEEFACPDGNFGRTGVFAGKGPDKKPDGWKLLVRRSSFADGNFIVFADKVFFFHMKSLTCTSFHGERLWQAEITMPGNRYRMHQVLGWQDKLIVVSANGSAKAFALDDGRLLWSAPGWERKEEIKLRPSTPEYERLPFAVVYKNCLHLAGERSIRRLGLADGKELKAFEFLEEGEKWALFTSPLVASDSTLFFSAMIDAPGAIHTHAIDLESGKLIWKQERTGRYNWTKDKILVADRKVVQLVGNLSHDSAPSVVGYDFTTGAKLPMNKLKSTYGAGSVFHQGALFFSQGNELAKVDILTGKKIWRYRGKENMKPVLAMGGSVIYARDSTGSMHAIHEADGSPLWISEAGRGGGQNPIIPANGALFRLNYNGVEVLGSPVETEPAPDVGGAMPSDPAAMRKEMEDIDRRIGELRKEWEECKQVLGETPASGGESDESKEQKEAASRRMREITGEVPQLKARRAELVKRLE